MTQHHHTLFALLASSFVVGGLQAQELDTQTATLKFKPLKSFKFILPSETWTTVGSTIHLRHPNGKGFRAIRNGLKLSVDTTGNGNTNKDVKGSKGYLVFRSKGDSGLFQYAARFRNNGKSYSFQSSCEMLATVGGVPIRLFDLNNNGRFDEVGTDGIVVGKGKAVAYLSEVISHKGKVFNFTVNGNTVSTTPFQGDVGTINVTSSFHSRGQLRSAIISDGRNSFNAAGVSDLTVPVGSYRVVSGFVGKGPASAMIRSGKMSPIRVRADQNARLDWGGKVIAEFSASLAGGKASVDPKNLHYYGRAGEEYYNLNRNTKSPRFTARNPESGKALGNFLFAGC